MYDVIIVGGGPAGLAAALVLGRCRRSVLVIDHGEQRNRKARLMHGYLTRDGIEPAEFLRLARAELAPYGVEQVRGRVEHAEVEEGKPFAVDYRAPGSATVERVLSRKLMLATGMGDVMPPLENIERFYGATVHHCPYCDGWEHRGKRLVAWGRGDAAIGLALALRTWSNDVTACSDGAPVSAEFRARARGRGIVLCEEKTVRLMGSGERVERIEFEGGGAAECDALFFNTGQYQRSDLPKRLSCSFKEDGGVETTARQCTGKRGLYLAGDADREVEFVIVAAAEGATAATAINRELQDDDEESESGVARRAGKGGVVK
ncbi:NAD(P)/FAD-dependent oxidoreductase [soil metagenome]